MRAGDGVSGDLAGVDRLVVFGKDVVVRVCSDLERVGAAGAGSRSVGRRLVKEEPMKRQYEYKLIACCGTCLFPAGEGVRLPQVSRAPVSLVEAKDEDAQNGHKSKNKENKSNKIYERVDRDREKKIDTHHLKSPYLPYGPRRRKKKNRAAARKRRTCEWCETRHFARDASCSERRPS